MLLMSAGNLKEAKKEVKVEVYANSPASLHKALTYLVVCKEKISF